ncbi:MAG: alpha amylase C-terminal domain-containing protein [Acidobacteria bacterium]|nr:alpha amylase C-terminal domain-containing protein [Acidobacteriota bacterium]
MGAIPFPGGATFRVWAPFAESVFVAGDFNNWKPAENPLAREGSGYWSVDAAGAQTGQQYKFVLRREGKDYWRIDPYAKQVTSSAGNAVICDTQFDWGEGVFQMPGWHEMVIYELHTGTFNDPPGGAPGVFDSIREKLPYLRDLGINAIEIMPSSEFPGGFSWGYNPSNIFAVETDYGGPRALKRLVKDAHEHGIAVIFDVVYNHLGPSDLDLWQFDGWSQDDRGGIYFYNDWRASTPWCDTRPDYGRPEVRQLLRDNLLAWAEEFRLDGFRFDATSYIRNVYGDDGDLPDGWNLLRWLNDELQRHQPWKITISEDLRNNAWLTRPTESGGAGFDSQWDGDFLHPVRRVLTNPFDEHRDMNQIVSALYHRYGTDALERVVYTESHDEVASANAKQRLPSDIDGGNPAGWHARKRSALGAVLVFTSPGIPMIFQGQEFLETGPWQDTVPVDWDNATRHAGVHLLYRDLIRLSRNWYDTTRGLRGQHVTVHHVNHADKVVAFHRWAEGGAGDDVVVVCNFANRAYDSYTLGVPREGLWRVRFNSDSNLYGPDYGNHPAFDAWAESPGCDGMTYRLSVGLGPYSAVILSQ